ncbi:MAG: uroporphyrinogen decarboxylase family protein [Planctomycetota bacterium]|jgi:uroporphyrinogen decarboxylase
MTPEQWKKLVAVIDGEFVEPVPVGFIIDSPWLPGWAGISMLDYFSSEKMWFEANVKVEERFPEVMFLPGFWSEFGMCTEPASFGAKCTWHENAAPFAGEIIADMSDIHNLTKPDPRTDGLTPFVLRRLQHYAAPIEQAGHAIKFAVARGPLNIACFLMNSTQFLMGIRTDPEPIHKLVAIVTDFLIDWLKLQAQTFSSIDGVLILDDIVGFLGEDDFKEIALPYLKRLFQSLDVKVRFFHNDAGGVVCAPCLREIGVNLFNFSYQHTLAEMRELAGDTVTLLGNIPPLDVLASGTPDEVADSVRAATEHLADKRRIVLSAGGGTPPGVSTENIDAFIAATTS